MYTYLTFYLSIYLSIYIPIYLYTDLSIYIAIYIYTYISIYISIYLYTYLSNSLSISACFDTIYIIFGGINYSMMGFEQQNTRKLIFYSFNIVNPKRSFGYSRINTVGGFLSIFIASIDRLF